MGVASISIACHRARHSQTRSFATSAHRRIFSGRDSDGSACIGRCGSRYGSLASFKSCGPANTDLCSLIEMRDADWHNGSVTCAIVPDSLLKIQGPNKAIAFDYDARRRIVRAYDSPTHGVSYSYDDGGRVSRVTASDGTCPGLHLQLAR